MTRYGEASFFGGNQSNSRARIVPARRGAARRGQARRGEVTFFRRNKMATKTKDTKKHISGEVPTNGGEESISMPYMAHLTIEGSADLLFHRWNCESVAEKAKAAKGSKAKKCDNVESYVYRNEENEICVPGEYLRQSIIMAAKYQQDPRSPRKSAMDLFKAGIVSLTNLASLGTKDWDYEDHRRVTIQRSAITRVRPAMKAGWKVEFDLQILLPEYIDQRLLNATITQAGRLVGIGDFRPTYGRFQITSFDVLTE